VSDAAGIKKIRESLRLSILSGLGWAGMAGLTQNYVTPFVLELKATSFQIGLLSSVPNLSMALSQLATPTLTQRMGSRKRITLTAIFLDALLWLPLVFIPFLFKQDAVWFILILFAFKGVAGSMGSPAWSSMMADLVPQGVRGRYFSWRGTLQNAAVLVFTFIAMGIMEFFKTRDKFIGFAILFGGAGFFRMMSAFFFSRQFEPPMPKKRESVDIWHAIRNLTRTNFGRLTILMSAFTFTGSTAQPFYAVYLYRDLKFDFLPYILVTTSPMLFVVLFQPYWGRRSDVAGNAKVMKLALLFAPIGPILWIVSPNVGYLVGLQVVGSFFNAGLNLALGNYIMDEAKRHEVTRNMAIFNAFMGISAFLGAFLGGVLATRLPPLLDYRLKTLFLLSGTLGIAVVTIGYRYIKEVRKVEKVSTINLLLGRYPGALDKAGGKSDYGFRILPEMSDEELTTKPADDEDRAK